MALNLSDRLTGTPIILLFIADVLATPREALDAEELDFPVRMRNVREANQFEECDGVLGEVIPEVFKKYPKGHKYEGKPIPNGASFMKAWKQARRDVLLAKGENLAEFEKAQADAAAHAATAAAEASKLEAKADGKKPWDGEAEGKKGSK